MVVRRTMETIENLKERPHAERRAVAGFISLGVVAVLLLGWLIAFFSGLTGFSAGTSFNTTASSTVQLFKEAQSHPDIQSLYPPSTNEATQ